MEISENSLNYHFPNIELHQGPNTDEESLTECLAFSF